MQIVHNNHSLTQFEREFQTQRRHVTNMHTNIRSRLGEGDFDEKYLNILTFDILAAGDLDYLASQHFDFDGYSRIRVVGVCFQHQ